MRTHLLSVEVELPPFFGRHLDLKGHVRVQVYLGNKKKANFQIHEMAVLHVYSVSVYSLNVRQVCPQTRSADEENSGAPSRGCHLRVQYEA